MLDQLLIDLLMFITLPVNEIIHWAHNHAIFAVHHPG